MPFAAADNGWHASKEFICAHSSVSSFLHDKGFLWGGMAGCELRGAAGEVEVEVATRPSLFPEEESLLWLVE